MGQVREILWARQNVMTVPGKGDIWCGQPGRLPPVISRHPEEEIEHAGTGCIAICIPRMCLDTCKPMTTFHTIKIG
jgi:hypothetical protein